MATYRKSNVHGRVNVGQIAEERIALVKLDGIGDFVLATTSLQLIEKCLPNADITLFCRAPVGTLARQQFPQWTVVELPKRQKTLRAIYGQHAARRLLKRQPPFDILIDLRSNRDMSDTAASSWIPAKAKLALRNQYPDELAWVVMPGEDKIYDVLLDRPDGRGVPQDIQNHRRLAQYLFPEELTCSEAMPSLRVSDVERNVVSERLRSEFSCDVSQPFLLVCPGAGGKIRQYPVEKLAASVINALRKMPFQVLVAGSSEDSEAASALKQELQGNAIDLTGSMTLAEHVALVSMAAGVLCMETSHAHIAGALGTPAIVIIGGGHYGLFAPWGESKSFRWLTNRLPCFGCHWKCIYDRPHCIQEISPDEIARHLAEVIKSRCTERGGG